MVSEPKKKKKILIIEELLSYPTSLETGLKDRGFEVWSIHDGSQLTISTGQPDEIQPDLIVLEVDPVGVSSFKLCQQIKKDRRLRAIPLIMFSNTPDLSNIMKAYKAGADHYVAKTAQNNH